jgi:hypothetical protein
MIAPLQLRRICVLCRAIQRRDPHSRKWAGALPYKWRANLAVTATG